MLTSFLKLMTCEEIEGVLYLKFYPRIKCGEDEHEFYFIFFGYILSAIIAIIIPLVVIIYCRSIAYLTLKKVGNQIRNSLIFRVGLIRSYWWWEIVS